MKLRWIEHAMEDFASLQRSIKSNKKGTVSNISTGYERIWSHSGTLSKFK